MVGYTQRDRAYDGKLNERETKVVLTIFKAALATVEGEDALPIEEQWINIGRAAQRCNIPKQAMQDKLMPFLRGLDASTILDAATSKLVWALCSDKNAINEKYDYELLTKKGLVKHVKNLKPSVQVIFEKIAKGGAKTLIVLDHGPAAPTYTDSSTQTVNPANEVEEEESILVVTGDTSTFKEVTKSSPACNATGVTTRKKISGQDTPDKVQRFGKRNFEQMSGVVSDFQFREKQDESDKENNGPSAAKKVALPVRAPAVIDVSVLRGAIAAGLQEQRARTAEREEQQAIEQQNIVRDAGLDVESGPGLWLYIHGGNGRVWITQVDIDSAQMWKMPIQMYMEWRVHNQMSPIFAVEKN